jgi:hypothetical protein
MAGTTLCGSSRGRAAGGSGAAWGQGLHEPVPVPLIAAEQRHAAIPAAGTCEATISR